MEPHEPTSDVSRSVPWTGVDVLCFFLLWLSLMWLCPNLFLNAFREQNRRSSPSMETRAMETTTDHPLAQLMIRGKESPVIIAVAFFSGVVTAPLAEEFLFRLLLQGWFTSSVIGFRNRFLREHLPRFRLILQPGVVSIFFVSLFFGISHGGGRVQQNIDDLFYIMLGVGVVNLFVFLLGIIFLRERYGILFTQLGFSRKRIGHDFLLGLITFLVTGPSILFLHGVLNYCFPNFNTDPIPLFLFSVVLGILFYTTRRLTPSIVLHACLNGFSFLALLFFS